MRLRRNRSLRLAKPTQRQHRPRPPRSPPPIPLQSTHPHPRQRKNRHWCPRQRPSLPLRRLLVPLNNRFTQRPPLRPPPSIHIISLKQVPKDFHARFSAKKKRYAYNIYAGYAIPTESRYCWSLGSRNLNIDLMNQAATYLIGKHDFSAFSATSRGSNGGDPIKEITRLDVTQRGSHIRITTEGSGYLYKMVRSIVGALVDVGLGKLPPPSLQEILKNQRRTIKVTTAPAKGLFLERVYY